MGLCILLTCSCEKVIDVNLKNATPQIVIEGIVTNEAGPYQVRISQTVEFSAGNSFPPVSGAVVSITDSSTGFTESLTEASPGTYITQSLQGFSGHTYQLYVSALGKEYNASSTMPRPVELDSVTFLSNSNFGDNIIDAVPNFLDPPGLGNYYKFTEYINGKQLKKTFAFEDRLSDGKYHTRQLFTDSAYIKAGDRVLVEMNCIDKNIYSYFNTLEQITDNNNFQSATPSNPNTNINNNALGYFSAQTVSRKEAVVP